MSYQPAFYPCVCYHPDHRYPNGVFFQNADEYNKANDGKWVRKPWEVKDEKPVEPPSAPVSAAKAETNTGNDPFADLTRAQIMEQYELGDTSEIRRMKRDELIAMAQEKIEKAGL